MKRFCFSIALLFFFVPALVNAETSVFYPILDGLAYREADGSSWDSIRSGSGTHANHTNANDNFTGLTTGGSGYYRMVRSKYVFDTSELPDDTTIISVSFRQRGSAKANTAGVSLPTVTLTSATVASTSSLDISDYNLSTFGTIDWADRITYANYDTTGYNTYVFNSSGVAGISKTGYTILGGRFGFDVDNTDPAGAAGYNDLYFNAYMSEQAGTSTDPYLEVMWGSGNSTTTSATLSDDLYIYLMYLIDLAFVFAGVFSGFYLLNRIF